MSLVIPVDPDKYLESPPAAFTASYDNLTEVPTDVLASRVVGSLINCEGNLNRYKLVLQDFIRATREDHRACIANWLLDNAMVPDSVLGVIRDGAYLSKESK